MGLGLYWWLLAQRWQSDTFKASHALLASRRLAVQGNSGDMPPQWPSFSVLWQTPTWPSKSKGDVLEYILSTPTLVCFHWLVTAWLRDTCGHWQAFRWQLLCLAAVGGPQNRISLWKGDQSTTVWLLSALRVFYSNTFLFHILLIFSF